MLSMMVLQQQYNKHGSKHIKNPLAVLLESEAHRVVAALTDNDSAGKGLIVDLNVQRPVPVVQSVLLDEVEVVYTGDLHAEKKIII